MYHVSKPQGKFCVWVLMITIWVFVATCQLPIRQLSSFGKMSIIYISGVDPGGALGARAPPLTTKNEAPAPKFYKTEAPEWQF